MALHESFQRGKLLKYEEIQVYLFAYIVQCTYNFNIQCTAKSCFDGFDLCWRIYPSLVPELSKRINNKEVVTNF